MHRDRIRLASLVLAVCLVSLPLFASGVAKDPAAEARAAEIREQYDALEPLTKSERRAAYAGLTPDVQRDLWVLHLERFLVDHPELTVEQRGVIYHGIGLLRGGVVERLFSGDAASIAMAHADMKHLEMRANPILQVDLTRQAFMILGPGTPTPELADAVDPKRRFKLELNGPYCSCNVASNDCDSGGCVYWRGTCTLTPSGCGFWGFSSCNGLCY